MSYTQPATSRAQSNPTHSKTRGPRHQVLTLATPREDQHHANNTTLITTTTTSEGWWGAYLCPEVVLRHFLDRSGPLNVHAEEVPETRRKRGSRSSKARQGKARQGKARQGTPCERDTNKTRQNTNVVVLLSLLVVTTPVMSWHFRTVQIFLLPSAPFTFFQNRSSIFKTFHSIPGPFGKN